MKHSQLNPGGRLKDIPLEKRIIFALDLNSPQKARLWVENLGSRIRFFKVGLELFLAGGFETVDWIIDQGNEVMLDLKFFDVPRTVYSAVSQTIDKRVSLITVHGNDSILEAAVKAGGADRILSVTALTSLDQGDLSSLGFACSPEELVLSRAKRALQIGCKGVVSSGLEVRAIRDMLGDKLCIVAPGVRPISNTEPDDQKRTVDPGQAFRDGCDHIVVGRPIRNSPNPLKTVIQMQRAIQEVFQER